MLPACVTSKANAERWAWEQARTIMAKGRPYNSKKGREERQARQQAEEAARVPTLAEFWPMYLDRCRADRQKPSTIDTKESLARPATSCGGGGLDCAVLHADRLSQFASMLGQSGYAADLCVGANAVPDAVETALTENIDLACEQFEPPV